MAVKKDNKVTPITLMPYHCDKLNAICKRTGLTKSGVIQRLLEQYNLFDIKDERTPVTKE